MEISPNRLPFGTRAIHLNRSLSNVDKFNYLRSYLESTAADAIAGLSLTSANYAEGVDTLKKRFGNTRSIVDKHMDGLLRLPIVTSFRDAYVTSMMPLSPMSEASMP